MAEVYAGQEAEFEDEQRKIITANGREVVVFKHDGHFYAFENNCPHNGGPVGEGILIGKVEAVLGPDQTLLQERFSDTETHLVCPWHGWEYNIANGACVGDPKRQLRKYEIVQREDGGVYVVA